MEDGGNGTGMEGFVGGVTDKGPSQQLTGGADRGFDYRGGPGRGGPDSRRGFRGTAENSKTKLCMRWMSPEGCRFGDRCNFAHGEHELRKLPPRPGSAQGAGRGPKDNGGRGGFVGYGANWQEGYADNRSSAGFDDYYRAGYSVRPPYAAAPSGYAAAGFPNQGPSGATMPGGPAGGFPGMAGAQGQLPGNSIPGAARTPHESVENIAWIASGCPVTGPGGWTQYRCAETGEYYYHNHRTAATTWDKPSEWGA